MTATPNATTATATLTRIRLNRRSTTVRRDLSDATQLHKTVMRLAPDHLGASPRQKAGLLFRLEPATDHTPPTLLIQSHHMPDLTRLPDTYGTAETRNLAPMFHALTPGQRVRYRITANASASRLAPEDRHPGSKKRGIVTPLHGEQALTWWHRRATAAGLTVITADATPVRFPRRSKEPGPLHALTRFDGTATVSDPEELSHAVLHGIGRGKPYGAGLLSLAPA
ncbi:type I-E CRISPR-associated protein Cas6/Cse3/CasE [Streptomyces sp. NPDC096354]|uniref:type I-E CRISPR-associated protein Cas6/Cse3/CasE n=1 Tax=Streptomyces sp. NPDC096354 TaxID=3366088 RepID=UPI0037F90738